MILGLGGLAALHDYKPVLKYLLRLSSTGIIGLGKVLDAHLYSTYDMTITTFPAANIFSNKYSHGYMYSTRSIICKCEPSRCAVLYNVSGDKKIGLGSSYGANVDAIETSTVVPTAWNTAYGLGT